MQQGGQRGISLGISLMLHATAFVFFMEAPGVELPRASETEYKQAISGKEQKIVWYKFRKELPRVTPPAAKAEKRALKAETVSKQAIVSSPKNAPKRQQMVWAPTPPVIAPPPLESPNVIAVKLPDQRFIAPPDIVKPQLAKVEVPDAPELKPLDVAAAQTNVKLPPKPYAAPPARPQRTPAVVPLATEAPQLAASNLTPGGGVVGPNLKLPPRPFTAPSGGTKRAASQPDLDAPPSTQDLNMAIVGLNPLEKATVLPSAPSPAAFSGGPRINPNGAVTEGGGKGITVPDLFVRGPQQQGKPDLIAQAHASPTSKETLRAAMRTGEPMITMSVPESGLTTRAAGALPLKVSGAPDPRFNGRDVFMMAIQMPNLTSYSGSWLMWYADHTAREAHLAPIAAPVPHRKVDPKYYQAAMAERVEGTVTLGCVVDKEGKVSGVELIRGIDDRLNQSAQEALAKWEFYPATRNGEPVEVDVLVEIPFRLAPKLPTR